MGQNGIRDRRSRPEARGDGAAPEGGWGWMVAFGMALMFVSTTAQYGSFGLLFDGVLTRMGAQTTGATLIMNALAAAVNFTGLVTNHLLRHMTYRMVSVIGALLFTAGVLLTIFAESMVHIIITYSIISGVGLGLVAPSSYLALNSYFLERRGLAMGLCQSAIGLGFIAAPPLVQHLLEWYGFRGTMLILAGLALHSVVGAVLYRPVSWYQRRRKKSVALTTFRGTDDMEDVPLQPPSEDMPLSLDVVPEEEDDLTGRRPRALFTEQQQNTAPTDADYEEHTVISRRGSVVVPASVQMDNSRSYLLSDGPRRPASASLANFASNVLMFDNTMADAEQPAETDPPSAVLRRKRQSSGKFPDVTDHRRSLLQRPREEEDEEYEEISNESSESVKPTTSCNISRSRFRRWMSSVAKSLDLRLLCDGVYVNIVLGLSVSFVSDTNFFTVFPFFLQSPELGFSGSDTAMCMSVAAGADVVARLVLPWVASRLRMTPRVAYLVGCLTSAVARSVFATLTSFTAVVITSGVVGFLKGAMVVNLSLTIADHCSLDRFAAAYSLYMVINGVITVSLGPMVGVIRDRSASFPVCIHVLSAVLALCSLSWSLEYMWVWYRCHRSGLAHKIKSSLC